MVKFKVDALANGRCVRRYREREGRSIYVSVLCALLPLVLRVAASGSAPREEIADAARVDAPAVLAVEFADGLDVLDPELARVKQRAGQPCYIRMLSPADASQVEFYVGMPLVVSFKVVCKDEDLQAFLLARDPADRGIAGEVHLDSNRLCNFTIPDVEHALRSGPFALEMQVTQWFETNIVLRAHLPLHSPSLLFHEAGGIQVAWEGGVSRTVGLQRAKHFLTITSWFGVAAHVGGGLDPSQYLAPSALATLPFVLEPAALHEDGLRLVSPAHGASAVGALLCRGFLLSHSCLGCGVQGLGSGSLSCGAIHRLDRQCGVPAACVCGDPILRVC